MKQVKIVLGAMIVGFMSIMLISTLLVVSADAREGHPNNGKHSEQGANSNHNNNGDHDNHASVEPPTEPPIEPPEEPPTHPPEEPPIITMPPSFNGSGMEVKQCRWRKCIYDVDKNEIYWVPCGTRDLSRTLCLAKHGF